MPTLASHPAEALAVDHRRRQQLLAAQVVRALQRLWRFGDWALVATRALDIMRAALVEAARAAQRYVTAAVRAWGARPNPFGQVAERAFAATASDGRPLDTLLSYPDFEARALEDQGMTHEQTRAVGERHLERIVATQVADAARVSTGVALANDRAAEGYIRLLTLPSCNRCIILAGQFYRWNKGFERHPQCDCVHQIATEVVDPPSPRAVYDNLTDEERRKAGWSGHDQRALDDGADLNQVTNYKRALKTVTIAGRPTKTTTVGTSRRGLAGKRGARVRLTPESVYLEADRLGWTRDATLAELKRHGYIL